MSPSPDPIPALRVDGDRLWSRLMEMAEIGATPAGGVHRLALTDQDRSTRDLFATWCEAAGLTISVDRMGSMFARRAGTDVDAPPVFAGSHLDSQPLGGRFDGPLGVLAALEAVETMNDQGIETRHSVEVVNWTNEEGSRFAPAMISSGVFAGVFEIDFAHAIEDASGATIVGELERIGYSGSEPVGGRPVRASFELHIEQGPLLERSGTAVGVVTGVQGARWYDVRIEGEVTHAGPFPMSERKDPVRGTARVLDRLFELVRTLDDEGKFTVGEIHASPGSRNTMPGQIDFTVDIRHPDDDALTGLDEKFRALVSAETEAMGLSAQIDQIWHSPTTRFAEECVDAVRAAAVTVGLSHMDVFSGAGHDSVYMQRVCPTGMIFVPCEGGLSHAEAENITQKDAEAGANVLMHSVLGVAGVAGAAG
jgi:N-carbamoyl-L-amino-acid hydrolase